jgi:hypothetical protein
MQMRNFRTGVAIAALMITAPAMAADCGPPNYGSDAASSAAFIKNFAPFFRNVDETAGQFLTRVCNAKFGGRAGGLEGLRALGISDQDIDSEDVVDLAVDALQRAQAIAKENSGK